MSNENSDSNSNIQDNIEDESNKVESTPCIDKLLANIHKNNTTSETELAPKKPPASKKTKLKKLENDIPRGKPKSGRPWKSVKTKFSNIKKSMHRRTFERKMELRKDIKLIKELSKSIKEQKKQENEMKKQRRLENAQRRLENERKSEVVQVIKNPAKLKRMKKKQLRMVEKRDLSKIKVV